MEKESMRMKVYNERKKKKDLDMPDQDRKKKIAEAIMKRKQK